MPDAPLTGPALSVAVADDLRRMDYMLAEKLFGWRWDNEHLCFFVPPDQNPSGFGTEDAPPLYAESWDAAGLLVEALRARGYDLVLNLELDTRDRHPEPWRCAIWCGGNADHEGRGATLPEALGRAALAVLQEKDQ